MPVPTWEVRVRLNTLGQVLESQSLGAIIERYENEYALGRSSDFLEIVDMLVRVLDTANQIGSQLQYYFRSYSPGCVQVNPFFYYFDEEEDLKDFLKRVNKYHDPNRIKIYWNTDDQKVVSVADDGTELVIGFVSSTDLS